MKVIFLDFDGVITIPPNWHINANKIKYIKQIVDVTGAKIVVSSSWRRENVKETINDMIGKTKRCPRNKMLYWLIDNLYDVTPWFCNNEYKNTGRGGEIQTWLDNHYEVDNYVIIDDDADMLDSQLFHFVQTNFEDGITELETKWAIKILNKQYFQNSMAINFNLRYQHLLYCNNLPNKREEIWKYNDHCKDMKKQL